MKSCFQYQPNRIKTCMQKLTSTHTALTTRQAHILQMPNSSNNMEKSSKLYTHTHELIFEMLVSEIGFQILYCLFVSFCRIFRLKQNGSRVR